MLSVMAWASSFIHSLFAFIIILVPLVVFHEFGHFVFAKIFGVKAEIFSVGFGPRLWWRQFGETEFRVSAIPMGGYVKLLGEGDDQEKELSKADQKRALHRQEPWKRFFIFLGGPLFNFILAIFIFMAILAIGEPQLSNVVGRVVKGSIAANVGFKSGDRILALDGKPIRRYEEVITILNENPKKKLNFTVLHPTLSQPVQIQVTTVSEAGFSMYGETTRVGEVPGLFPVPRSNLAGVSNPKSSAGKAGIKTGAKITQIDQKPISNWEELESLYESIKPGRSFTIQFQTPEDSSKKSVTWTKPHAVSDLGEAFGLFSSELFVEKAVHKSPAEASGILPGDRLVGVGKKDVHSFFDLKDAVQDSGEKTGTVELRWERNGRPYSAQIVPTATKGRDVSLNKTTQYTVGVVPMLVLGEPNTVIERIWNPFTLLYKGTERMVTFSWRNFISLKKILTGDVSVGTLGGPIMIGKIAGESLARGLISFLTNMAIFSIGLGVLNILPVPVLDGGHLMLLGIEIFRGKPLTLRQMEIIQSVGLILILALMGIAFRNDLARLIYL